MEAPSIVPSLPVALRSYNHTLRFEIPMLKSWKDSRTQSERNILPPLSYALDAVHNSMLTTKLDLAPKSPKTPSTIYPCEVITHISPRRQAVPYTSLSMTTFVFDNCSKVQSESPITYRNYTYQRCQRRKCRRTAKPNDIYCKWHVDSRICRMAGCEKSSKAGGYCIAHGGGKRCQYLGGCLKSAKQGGLCIAHGGGIRCKIPNCSKSAVCNRLCVAHGGGRRSSSICPMHLKNIKT